MKFHASYNTLTLTRFRAKRLRPRVNFEAHPGWPQETEGSVLGPYQAAHHLKIICVFTSEIFVL